MNTFTVAAVPHDVPAGLRSHKNIAALLAVCVGMAVAGVSAQATTTLTWGNAAGTSTTDTGGSGNWNDTTNTGPWLTSSPVARAAWTDNSIAQFNNSNSGTVTLASSVSPYALNFLNGAIGYTIADSTSVTIPPTLSVGAGGINLGLGDTGQYSTTISTPLAGSTPLVITAWTNIPTSNASPKNTFSLTADSSTAVPANGYTPFTAGVTVGFPTGNTLFGNGSVTLTLTNPNIGSTANHYFDLTTAGTGPITIDAPYSSITQASPSSMGQNFYGIHNDIILNPGNHSAILTTNSTTHYNTMGFVTAMAASSTPAGSPYSNTIIYYGQISGNADIDLSNDYFGGGGKGATILTNSNNSWTGKLIINNNGTSQIYEMAVGGNDSGNHHVIPVDPTTGAGQTDLVFGFNSIVPLTKPVGYFNLNGHDVTVRSLSADLGSFQSLGIVNNNDVGAGNVNSGTSLLPGVIFGANGGTMATPGTVSTLIIDDQRANSARIADQTEISKRSTPYTVGTYSGPIRDGLSTDNNGYPVLQVGLKLDSTNLGSLTLTGNVDAASGTAALTYSGPTTVNGGSLFINGALSSYNTIALTGSSRTVSSAVTVASVAGSIPTLGGGGSIVGSVTIGNSGTAGGANATIMPGTTATTPGVLTLLGNVTFNDQSTYKWIFTDAAGLAGVGYSQLNLASAASLVANGTVTVTAASGTNPTNFDPTSAKTWILATGVNATVASHFTFDGNAVNASFSGTGSSLSAISSGGGTWKLIDISNNLELVFTPSAGSLANSFSWTGASTTPGTGNWDLAAGNWQNNSSLATGQQVTSNASVTFGDQASAGTGTITISSAVSPSFVTFANTSGHTSYVVTGAAITGTTPLLITNSGSVTFATANTYSGGTTVANANGTAGTIVTKIAGALGSGAVTLQGATWDANTATQSYANNLNIINNATIQVDSATFGLTLTGTVTGNGTAGGSLTKTGLGTLTVAHPGYHGDTVVPSGGGTLTFSDVPAYTGATQLASGTVMNLNQAAGTYLTLHASDTATVLNSDISGTINMTNAMTLQYSTGTYTGNGIVNVLAVKSAILGAGTVGGSGGTNVTISNQFVLPNAKGTVYIGMSGNGNQIALNGVISGGKASTGILEFAAGSGGGGAATIVLGAANTYAGLTYIEIGGTAKVMLGTNNGLPAATTLNFGDGTVNSNTGGFDLNGYDQTVAGISDANLTLLGNTATGIENSGYGTHNGFSLFTIVGAASTANVFNTPITGPINLVLASSTSSSYSLKLSTANTYSGGTTINAGTLIVKTDAQLGYTLTAPDPTNSNITMGGTGTLDIATTTTPTTIVTQRSLTLTGGSPTIQIDTANVVWQVNGGISGPTGTLVKNGLGTLQFGTASPNTLSKLGGLTISNGYVDLQNNDLSIANSSQTAANNTAATLITDITAGTLKTTSGTSGLMALAVETGQAYHKTNGSAALFDGQTVADTDVLVKYTYAGDTNLDGKITADDYLALDLGYMFHLTGYANGDFNGAGSVTLTDFAIIDNSYKHQGAQLADGEIALHTQWFGAQYTDALNALNAPVAVPEPASLSLLAIGAAGLLARRHNKK